MASVLKNDGMKDMADQAETGGAPESREIVSKSAAVPPKYVPPVATGTSSGGRSGFFTIYKKGQGYWTRIGTVGAAALLALLTAQFLYSQGRIWFQINGNPNLPLVLGMVSAFVLIFALVIYRVINRPNVVDFLIATDGEMKKVNWTSRAELIGSTKVVIIFMLFIAFFLFALDTIFGYFFHVIHVLQFGPFG
jgi:preprotein translocase subunit SecE